jgi:hypothetical protein
MKQLFLTILLFYSINVLSQSLLVYRTEAFGSAASGDFTPFWMTSNSHNMVSVEPGNAYIRGELLYEKFISEDFNIQAGLDIVASANNVSSIWPHQAYIEAHFQKASLTAGIADYYISLADRELSQGDLCFSDNARTIPRLLIGFPEFTTVPWTKGLLQFKADFAVGKSVEDNYILRARNTEQDYNIGTLYHHKSLFFRIAYPQVNSRFAFLFGLVHAAQWGGQLHDAATGAVISQPTSFSDFLRVVQCRIGDENATASDQINVLGNHLGTINARFEYNHSAFAVSLYKQHLFEDQSGIEYANWRDGIWGGEIGFKQFNYIEKLVIEFLNTTNQSGPMHFITYDRRQRYRGGGSDDYYNNGDYHSGWSYFGRGIGNPLLTSPIYNSDGSLIFKDTRIKSAHVGMKGNIARHLRYRVLLTRMTGWGRMKAPFFETKHNTSLLTELAWSPEKWKGWRVSAQIAADSGDMYGSNFGFSLKLSKHGVLLPVF